MTTTTQNLKLELLKELYTLNCEDQTFYKDASGFAKRVLFQSFFKRLSWQKQSFCSALEILILNEKEQVMNEFSNHSENNKPSQNNCFYYFDYKRNRNKVIKECYKKESLALKIYDRALAQLKDEKISYLLELHRTQIDRIIREMKVMGVNRFLV